MEIYTIGFTKKSAEEFFERLRNSGIERLLDVRLRNTSHLAGFAKKDDLKYFLKKIVDADYDHDTVLAPTDELLSAYRDKDITWDQYEERFRELMEQREIENHLKPGYFDKRTVLLCSEHKPDKCHRRLLVEYLAEAWGNVEAVHL